MTSWYSDKFISRQNLNVKASYFNTQLEVLKQRYNHIIKVDFAWLDYWKSIDFTISWDKQTNMLDKRFEVINFITNMLSVQYVHNFSINNTYKE
jgi:uncharacterized Fe-S cluster-containing radical SAM superfamily protein